MQLKTIRVYYLLSGISAILLASRCGRADDIDIKIVTTDLVYMNQTDSTVAFFIAESNSLKEVKLMPRSSSEIFTYIREVNKNSTPGNCCQGMLGDVSGSSANLIFLNDTLCTLHDKERSDIISNYATEVITNRHYRYIYTFTRDDFENAELCE